MTIENDPPLEEINPPLEEFDVSDLADTQDITDFELDRILEYAARCCRVCEHYNWTLYGMSLDAGFSTTDFPDRVAHSVMVALEKGMA